MKTSITFSGSVDEHAIAQNCFMLSGGQSLKLKLQCFGTGGVLRVLGFGLNIWDCLSMLSVYHHKGKHPNAQRYKPQIGPIPVPIHA